MVFTCWIDGCVKCFSSKKKDRLGQPAMQNILRKRVQQRKKSICYSTLLMEIQSNWFHTKMFLDIINDCPFQACLYVLLSLLNFTLDNNNNLVSLLFRWMIFRHYRFVSIESCTVLVLATWGQHLFCSHGSKLLPKHKIISYLEAHPRTNKNCMNSPCEYRTCSGEDILQLIIKEDKSVFMSPSLHVLSEHSVVDKQQYLGEQTWRNSPTDRHGASK